MAVFDSEVARLVDALTRIESESSKLGLHITWAKTIVQNLGSGPLASSAVIHGQQVDSLSQLCYLNQIKSFNMYQALLLRYISVIKTLKVCSCSVMNIKSNHTNNVDIKQLSKKFTLQ
jgi:hypothetical protein